MSINRHIKKMSALVLVAAAVGAVVVTQVGGHSVAAGAGARPAASIAANRGDPNAVPPILPPLTRSQSAAIRSAEAQEAAEFDDPLPASAPYSNAETNAYGSVHK